MTVTTKCENIENVNEENVNAEKTMTFVTTTNDPTPFGRRAFLKQKKSVFSFFEFVLLSAMPGSEQINVDHDL
jgi:hypothetical protein